MRSVRFVLFSIMILTLATSCERQDALVDNSAPAWYKQQVIYNLDIKVFKDSDGDGKGDIKGLISKLGYLDSLGVTTIWLAPFQPSPLQDDGYDVADFTAVDSSLGTLSDFKDLLRAAKRRNIRVIIDVVLNHTSIRHPWFRQRPNWYLWSAERPNDWDKGMGFPEVEKQTWLRDSLTGKYYFHRFYHFQPDLNFQNSQVVAEAERILAFWLRIGVDGFRLDAVPFIIDDPRRSAEDPDHDFNILHKLARSVKKIKPDAVLLGEANVEPEETKDYFSRQDEGLDMMLNFEVNQYLFYALASGESKPLIEALKATANKPPKTQWGYFLRNHDEVDLGKLNARQYKQVCAKFGPDTTMQLYGRGIRRRLAPMLKNDLLRLKQAYTILFALPGTPIIRYGEEIGMGDDLNLKERLSVRTPMQWDSSINAGFTSAQKPFRPLIDLGEYRSDNVNVKQRQIDETSLINFTYQLIALRKRHFEIGQGRWEIVEPKNKHCLVINHRGSKGDLMAVVNFSDKEQHLLLPVKGKIKDLVSGRQISIEKDGSLTLPAYAAYWLSIQE